MKIHIKYLRWILIILYIAVITGLLIDRYREGGSALVIPLFLLVLITISQIIFIFGTGTIKLCHPIQKRRILIPVIVSALMMTILFGTLGIAFVDLFIIGYDIVLSDIIFFPILILIWIIWSIIFYIYTRGIERYKVIWKLIRTVLVGSLLELLASVPSHIIVKRRGGCFVGFGTMIGIIGGVSVMIWAFGPGILLLFFKDKYKKELKLKKK